MDKQKWFNEIPELMERMGFASRMEDDRVVWATFFGEEDGDDDNMVFGEMFLASSLGIQQPEDMDILQLSVVFMHDIPLERYGELQMLCSMLCRRMVGGYFAAHRADESCFLEYAWDIPVLIGNEDYESNRLVENAVDLSEAYIGLSYHAFEAAVNGADAQSALELLNEGLEQ